MTIIYSPTCYWYLIIISRNRELNHGISKRSMNIAVR
jgi:hypothetical protein